jgi:hypothetical protein
LEHCAGNLLSGPALALLGALRLAADAAERERGDDDLEDLDGDGDADQRTRPVAAIACETRIFEICKPFARESDDLKADRS